MTDLAQLYAEIDRLAERLALLHGARLKCGRGCAACCVDGLTVFEVEARHIEATHADLLAQAPPHPPGACAFLAEDNSCRIYEARPYVCRTQGLPLRWLEETDAGEIYELRDICPLNENEADTPVEELPSEDCWTLGPYEEELARRQMEVHGDWRRVALRELFAATRLCVINEAD